MIEIARNASLLILGTLMLPLWLAGAIARAAYEAIVIGWILGEYALEWVRDDKAAKRGRWQQHDRP